jgi:hypothetical protein
MPKGVREQKAISLSRFIGVLKKDFSFACNGRFNGKLEFSLHN